MYVLVLTIHSLVRWLVLVLGVVAVGRGLRGWIGRRSWDPQDERASLLLLVALDVQLLLGLLLYLFLSPFTTLALREMGVAMRNAPLRYWAVEHLTMMLVAVVIVHVARVRIKRAADPTARHRRATVLFAVALILILAAIPWPGTRNGRPLLRLGSQTTPALPGLP
ncbi:MAG: hypothetical protein HYX76_13330 [Acidobacteria bacterium]|nr:hypothetical protein [Acidobacteriota bacterium]